MKPKPFRPTRRDVLAAAPAAAVAGAAIAAPPVPASRPAGEQPPATPEASPIRLRIKASRRAGIAPFGVIFEVETARDDDLLHGEFVWDFGERYDFETMPGDKRPARSAGASRGPAAAHVFVTPGTHTVRLIMLRDGEAATAEMTVVVRDANEHFDGQHTVAVSAEGDFAGAPNDAFRARNLEDAARAARALTPPRGGRDGPRGRLLLRAGETFALGAPIAVGSLHVDRFGEGDDPVIRADMPRFVPDPANGPGGGLIEIAHENGATYTTVANLALEGAYRPDDPAPVPDPSIHVSGIARSFQRAPQHTTLFRLRLDGVSGNIMPGENAVVADCLFRDWHYYALFGHGERHAVIGNRMLQHPLATRGPGERRVNDPAFRNHAEQGPVRFANNDLAVYSRNVMHSTSGWSKFYDGFAVQPVIRHQPNSGARGYFGENQLIGGWGVISHEEGRPERGLAEGWIIEAQNFVEGDGETEIFVRTPYGRHIVRNCIFVAAAPEPLTPAAHFRALVLGPRSPSSAAGGLEAYANTFVARHPHRAVFELTYRASGAPEALLAGNLVIAEGFEEVTIGSGAVRLPADAEPLDGTFRPRAADAVPERRDKRRRAIIDFSGKRRTGAQHYGALEP
ncbi:MAG: hypothetical protein AAFV96_04200 [Pseudomonadota bacterium]